MKKNKIKKIMLVCASIVTPIMLGSIVSASCSNDINNQKNNSDTNEKKQSSEADITKNTSNDSKKANEHDHSKHDHSETNVDKPEKEESELSLSAKVDKLEESKASVVGLDVDSVDGTNVSFSMRLSNKIDPNSSLQFVVVDEKGNEIEKTAMSANKKGTKLIKFSFNDLEPQANYTIKRVVLNNQRSSLNRPIPFQTEKALPPLPTAQGNYVNAIATNVSNTFEVEEIPGARNNFYRTLNLRFENFEDIKGEKITVTLRAVGSIDNKEKLPEQLEVTSDPFKINEDGTAKIVFTNHSVKWKINYSIVNISLVLEEPQTETDNSDETENYVSVEKTYNTPLTVTDNGKTVNITKISFEQDDTNSGEFTLTFDSEVEKAETSKIFIKTKQLSSAVTEQGGYANRNTRGRASNTLVIAGFDLDFSEANPIESIKFGETVVNLTEDQKLVIPKNNSAAPKNDDSSTQPKEETQEEKNRKNKLSNIVFSTQQGLVLKAGYHPSHYFLPDNAVATDGLPEETVSSENLSLDKYIYDAYKVLDRVPGKSDGSTSGKNQFLLTLLIDEDPIFNIEPNIFITAKLQDIFEGDSSTKGRQIESELSPVYSNGSSWVIFKDDTESAIDFNSKYKIVEINVWRKPINSEEKTLVKKFTPKELNWSDERYGSGLPRRYHN